MHSLVSVHVPGVLGFVGVANRPSAKETPGLDRWIVREMD